MLFLDAVNAVWDGKTMKTTQRSSYRRARLALFAGLAALTAALAFTAALRFASDSRDETAQQEAPPANAGGENKDREEPAEEAALPAPPSSDQTVDLPSQTSPNIREAPKHSPPKTFMDALGPDLERWLQIVRTQLGEQGEQGAELERILDSIRKTMESMDPSGWEEFLGNIGIAIWRWNPEYPDLRNWIRQKLFELNGTTRYPEITPPEIIEILVEGMDDLTAAQKLYNPTGGGLFSMTLQPPTRGWRWRAEPEYAKMYLERALAKDPTSREGLALKIIMSPREEKGDVAFRLLELYPNDAWAVRQATAELWRDFPEETIAAVEPLFASKDIPEWAHHRLSYAYERLDMIDKAVYHNSFLPTREEMIQRLSTPTMAPNINMSDPSGYSGKSRRVPSIWEERAAAAAAEAAQQAASSAESVAPGFEGPFDPRDFEPPHSHDHPDASRGVEPPPGAAMDMAAAYADFAKAYQDAFKMEYGLSEATPEGYMNALLGMARAFAKAGDARRAQNAYNAVRKRHSREEIEQVFRRFDEQERLKRQPPSDDENGEEDEDP